MRGSKKKKFEEIDREKKNILETAQYQKHLEAREEKFGYILTETCSAPVKINV